MLRTLWLIFLYTSFVGLGISAPFIATLGYVWVDTFQPQYSAYFILNQFPVAMIMGALAVGGYILTDRRSVPPISLETVLHVGMACWVTLTLMWAEVPDPAWSKWDWAFKTLIFSAFIPYVIRSRVQIEAFAQTYVFSLAANIIPFGAKTLISGGGYGTNLGLQSGNSGLSEGGYLSTVCLMVVPLALYLSRHHQLLPRIRLVTLAYWGIAGLAIVTAIGTYERSALIGLVAMGIYMWIRSKHKVGFGIIIALVACLVVYSTSSAWNARISTIGSFEKENSAYTRILVWRWTLEYSFTHPLGGGFMSYMIDHVEVPANGANPGGTEFGRAFHSIYFEMLGEQGYPGLLIFLTVVAVSFLRLRRLAKKTRGDPEFLWVAELADALQSGLAVFMTSAAFVGIAFQPMVWYFISMGVSLNAYMWRVERMRGAAPVGWRALIVGPPNMPVTAGPTGGWRTRASSQSLLTTSPRQ